MMTASNLPLACATCIADNAALQEATNKGIWLLLAVLFLVFLGIAGLAWRFAKLQRTATRRAVT